MDGPRASVVEQAKKALAGRGVSADWQPGTSYLSVRGRAAEMEAAFELRLHDFRDARGHVFYRELAPGRVPENLTGLLSAVGRVSDQRVLHTFSVPRGGLTPTDTVKAYGAQPLRAAGIDGTGETIVLFSIDSFVRADLEAFRTRHNLPAFDVTEHLVPPNGQRPASAGEATMDLEILHSIAPGAKLVVYTFTGQSDADIVQLFSAGLRDNPRSVATASFGGCESALGETLARQLDAELTRAAAIGTTVFASSGDSGGYDCYGQDWSDPPSQDTIGVVLPAALPSVTGVGGTRISVQADGSWRSEVAWTEPARLTGGGGGVSRYFSRPSWQTGPGTTDGAGTGRRLVPDVAADADPSTGIAVHLSGSFIQGGGTSQAAPIWAGLTTLVNSYLKRRGHPPVGFANPAFYQLAGGDGAAAFHDVRIGSNSVYPTGAGYDMVTGLGTPNAGQLARGLERLAAVEGR
jgi:kumamolisin